MYFVVWMENKEYEFHILQELIRYACAAIIYSLFLLPVFILSQKVFQYTGK